jgi:ABC-type Zn uptake system ZnuABC Zn-binding protein ZnuA
MRQLYTVIWKNDVEEGEARRLVMVADGSEGPPGLALCMPEETCERDDNDNTYYNWLSAEEAQELVDAIMDALVRERDRTAT